MQTDTRLFVYQCGNLSECTLWFTYKKNVFSAPFYVNNVHSWLGWGVSPSLLHAESVRFQKIETLIEGQNTGDFQGQWAPADSYSHFDYWILDWIGSGPSVPKGRFLPLTSLFW